LNTLQVKIRKGIVTPYARCSYFRGLCEGRLEHLESGGHTDVDLAQTLKYWTILSNRFDQQLPGDARGSHTRLVCSRLAQIS